MKPWIYCVSIWPEPAASAAGVRSHDMIETFKDMQVPLLLASHAKVPEGAVQLKANDSSFEDWLRVVKPQGIIFDRFLMEEYYGARVRAVDASILRVIDAQDLHFLRHLRSLKPAWNAETLPSLASSVRTANDPRFLREWTAIRRSHLTLLLSTFEYELLTQLDMPENLLHQDGFHQNSHQPQTDGSGGAVWIGNFRHAPNRDAVIYLKETLWPKVRERCPDAKVTLFGSYPDKACMQLHAPDQGFFVHGPAKHLDQVFRTARINLAPLRFGAGIKGKIFEGWRYGVPAAASPLAAEGMDPGPHWGGRIAPDEATFVEDFRVLWQKGALWDRAQANAYRILDTRFGLKLSKILGKRLFSLEIQKGDIFANVLHWSRFDRSKYFSKWLEEKCKHAT